MRLLLIALAVFWAWEYGLDLSPIPPPAWLGAPLVALLALGASYVPDRWLLVIAAAGVVGVLHNLVRLPKQAPALSVPRQNYPRGVGNRLPPLP